MLDKYLHVLNMYSFINKDVIIIIIIREVSVSLNTHSLYRVDSDLSYLCEYQVALS